MLLAAGFGRGQQESKEDDIAHGPDVRGSPFNGTAGASFPQEDAVSSGEGLVPKRKRR
jgi:hypothetical protein